MLQLTRAQLLAAMNGMIATGDLLDGVAVRLFKSPVLLTPDIALTDFEEATFSGYTPSTAIDWNTAFFDVSGNVTVEGCVDPFIATGTPTAETIYGFYLTKVSGGALVGAANLPVPVPIVRAGDAVVVRPKASLPPTTFSQ